MLRISELIVEAQNGLYLRQDGPELPLTTNQADIGYMPVGGP